METTSAIIQPLVRIARPPVPNEQRLVLLRTELLVKAVESQLTPDSLARIKAEFGPYLSERQYPPLVGNALVDLLCELCLADRPLAEARKQLGYQYMLRYWQTPLGKMVMPAMRVMGLERIMRGLPRNYATSANYGIYWVAQLGPQHWRFDMEDDPRHPEVQLGTLLAGADVLPLPNHQISLTRLGPEHMSVEIRWA
jgi:uncharacterized protein (TIGR02265 family)